MTNNILLGRQIKIETSVRCDYCHRPIEVGKFGTQVTGDPKEVQAQGLFHGRLCYEGALADYQQKKEDFDMVEEAKSG